MSAPKAIRTAAAFVGSLLLAVVFLFASDGEAHVVPAASVEIDCTSVRFDFSYFPPGPAELAITVTQGDDVLDVTGVTGVNETEGSVYVPIALTGTGPVTVQIGWDVDGGGSTNASGSLDCAPVVPEVVPDVPPTPCTEDMPCWDCETMGNRLCGPVVPTELVPPAVETAPVTPVEVLSAPEVPQVAATSQEATETPSLPVTGRGEVAAEALAGCLLLAAGFAMLRRGARRSAGLTEAGNRDAHVAH